MEEYSHGRGKLNTELYKRGWSVNSEMTRRTSKTYTVECSSRSLEGVDDVEGSDGFALSVLRVGDRVSDDTLQELFEDTASLLVDQATV